MGRSCRSQRPQNQRLPPRRLAPPPLCFPPSSGPGHAGEPDGAAVPLFPQRTVGTLLKGQASCPRASHVLPVPVLPQSLWHPDSAAVSRGGSAGAPTSPGRMKRVPAAPKVRGGPSGHPQPGRILHLGRAAAAGRGSSRPPASRGKGRKNGVSPGFGGRRRAEVGAEAQDRQDPVLSLFDSDEEGPRAGQGIPVPGAAHTADGHSRHITDPPLQRRCPVCLGEGERGQGTISPPRNGEGAPPIAAGAPSPRRERTDDGHDVRQHVALRHPIQPGLKQSTGDPRQPAAPPLEPPECPPPFP